jgi:uncharacterized protein (TIGR02588 family)
MPSKESHRLSKPQSTSLAEWTVAGLGALFVAVTIGYLIYFEFTTSSSPPDIDVRIQDISRQGSNYVVSFDVRNKSPRTAANLRVVGDLSANGTSLESSDVVFDYVPAFSSRHDGLLFQHDPSAKKLEIRALSFISP